jgi:hypothetical protein
MVNNTARKLFSTNQKKQYRKHQKLKGILIGAITHVEFLNIVDKSSKSIWICVLLVKGINKLRRPRQISVFYSSCVFLSLSLS